MNDDGAGQERFTKAATLDSFSSRYVHYRRRVLFYAGVALMVGSFLVYLAYPVVVILPVSADIKIALLILASLLSWSMFSIGVLLAGLETYEWLKELLKKGLLRW